MFEKTKLILVPILFFLSTVALWAANTSSIIPTLFLLLSDENKTNSEEIIPTLTLMVAIDTDKIAMAWMPGSDRQTPNKDVVYHVYLSKNENFTPNPTTLANTVVGDNQVEITGLSANTLYFGKVIAKYKSLSSKPSNELETKTYVSNMKQDPSVTVENADLLGLGKHTTSNGTTYTYNTTSSSLPQVGDVLYSEDIAGGNSLRKIESVTNSPGVITVQTSDASLTDAVDRGSVYSSFQLVNAINQGAGAFGGANGQSQIKSLKLKNGSDYFRFDWKNKLLATEQINHSIKKPDLILEPHGESSTFKLKSIRALADSFTATVTANFEPKVVTQAEWGGVVFKELESAEISAKGTLSVNALAQFNFTGASTVKDDFELFKRKWTSVYPIGATGLFVYQEIIFTLDVEATATSQVKTKATASADLTEAIEVGAKYDGASWTPFITRNDSQSLTASLDIAGEAQAELRLIPKIDVVFYKVINSNLTVEPSIGSNLTFETTTSNAEFLAMNPNRQIQLTSFDGSLGIESNVSVYLSGLGSGWAVLNPVCVLGSDQCIKKIEPFKFFSIPALDMSVDDCTATLIATDGINNPFEKNSAKWEIYPADATITGEGCTKANETTTCTASIEGTPGTQYTVFGSGHGRIGEPARQYKNFAYTDECQLELTTKNSIIVNKDSDAEIVLELSQPLEYPVTVEYSTVEGSAKSGTHFIAQNNGQIKFMPGETQKSITIDVLHEQCRKLQGDPNFNFSVNISRVTLESPIPRQISPSTNNISIVIDAELCKCPIYEGTIEGKNITSNCTLNIKGNYSLTFITPTQATLWNNTRLWWTGMYNIDADNDGELDGPRRCPNFDHPNDLRYTHENAHNTIADQKIIGPYGNGTGDPEFSGNLMKYTAEFKNNRRIASVSYTQILWNGVRATGLADRATGVGDLVLKTTVSNPFECNVP